MNFDLQRFSTGKFYARQNGINYSCSVNDSGVGTPRLTIRRGGKNYSVALKNNAVNPRLAANVNGSTKYISLLPADPVVYLPCNNSITEELSGKTCTATGSPTIQADTNAFDGKSAYFDGSSWLLVENVTLGGQDFTIDFWMTLSSSSKSNGQIVFVDTTSNKYDMVLINRDAINYEIYFRSNTKADVSAAVSADTAEYSTISCVTTRARVELVYRYVEQNITLYINGVPAAQRNGCPKYTRQTFRVGIFGGAKESVRSTGTLEHFRIYDGIATRTENYIAPNSDDFYKGCAVWLPFTASPTEDHCGNTWTTVGTPVIQDDENAISGKSIYFDGSSGLVLNEIELGGQDFTIDGWVNMDSSTPSWGRVFRFEKTGTGLSSWSVFKDRNGTGKLEMWSPNCVDYSQDMGNSQRTATELTNQRVHFAMVYSRSAKTVTLFINGTQAAQSTARSMYNRSKFTLFVGGKLNNTAQFLTGTLEHFRIHDGVALWTDDFTPPTASDYD